MSFNTLAWPSPEYAASSHWAGNNQLETTDGWLEAQTLPDLTPQLLCSTRCQPPRDCGVTLPPGVSEAVCEAAKTTGVDMVVLGSRGMGAIKR